MKDFNIFVFFHGNNTMGLTLGTDKNVFCTENGLGDFNTLEYRCCVVGFFYKLGQAPPLLLPL